MDAAAAGPLRVLDVGCGAGVDAVALAKRGHQVTAVDRDPTAVRWTRQRAERAGVSLRVEEADVLSVSGAFDLVLDFGCLHSLRGDDRDRYFERLSTWLAPRGQYILMHFIKRGFWELRPRGPLRVRPAVLEAALSPILQIEQRRTQRHPGRPGLGAVRSLTISGRRR